jgi:hypothetical protein
MARKVKKPKRGKLKRRMGGRSSRLTGRQLKALRVLNQDFSW